VFTPTPRHPVTPSPHHVGRFQVRARLGAGAFGTVYRAWDPRLEREVALKVPREGTLDSPQRLERFLREARAAARLRHPHIVPVYEAGQAGGGPFIATAFIPGQTLAAVLEAGPLDYRRAARLGRALALALAYAHGQGVVHRDVKPANVLIDAQDQPLLTDFGLARRQDATRLTQLGTLLGTPAYMAPEQAAGQTEDTAPASDQYSLGVVLYEMLTGQTPFNGPADVVLYHHLHSPPPPLRSRQPDVPADLEALCLRALAKRPADRHPSCQALADALARWSEEGPPPGIEDRAPGGAERGAKDAPPSTLQRPRPSGGSHRLVVFLGLLVFTGVGIAVGAFAINKLADRAGVRTPRRAPAKRRSGDSGDGARRGSSDPAETVRPTKRRSPFEGNWRGSTDYVADIDGEQESIQEFWELTVDARGNLSGELNSSKFGNVSLKGQVKKSGAIVFHFTTKDAKRYRGEGTVKVIKGDLVGTITFYRGNEIAPFFNTQVNLSRQ
jgi:tRNA A-37 threonylcarbamoyl transferase component Bud32